MDKDLIKNLISQSKYCDFESFLNTSGLAGDLGVRVKVKEPIKKLPQDFSFDISLFNSSRYSRTNDNAAGVYTGHWIYINNDGCDVACKILNELAPHYKYNFGNWTKGMMISIKANYDESIVELIDRWGMKFSEKNYQSIIKKRKNTELTPEDLDGKILVNYSKQGEIYGYNTLEKKGNGKTVLSFKEDGPLVDYNIPNNARYIGKRIGKYFYNDSEIIEHRVKQLSNGKQYLNRIANINISVIGCGGIGSNVIDFLIRKGARNINVYDDDEIEEINFQRLPLESRKYLGEAKVEMFNDIKGINLIGIKKQITVKNVSELVCSDVIIMAADNLEVRELVSKYSEKEFIPYINCGVNFRNNIPFSMVSYYGAPGMDQHITNGIKNPDNEYNKIINLQLCEQVVMTAAKAVDIITRTCGLYTNDNLDLKKGWCDNG